ncbi:MAG TPA: hypothetical protein VGL98_06145 [Gammaproteobacteria bacterium]
MSISGDRQAIADALSTVDGVTGSRYRPTVIAPGAAWPLLDSLAAADGVPAFEVTWRVLVALPTGEQRASEWFDEHHEELADALADFGYVERIEPGRLDTEAGDIDIMIITVRKEA